MEERLQELNLNQLKQLARILVAVKELDKVGIIKNKKEYVELISKANIDALIIQMYTCSTAQKYYLICKKCKSLHWSANPKGIACDVIEEFDENYLYKFMDDLNGALESETRKANGKKELKKSEAKKTRAKEESDSSSESKPPNSGDQKPKELETKELELAKKELDLVKKELELTSAKKELELDFTKKQLDLTRKELDLTKKELDAAHKELELIKKPTFAAVAYDPYDSSD